MSGKSVFLAEYVERFYRSRIYGVARNAWTILTHNSFCEATFRRKNHWAFFFLCNLRISWYSFLFCAVKRECDTRIKIRSIKTENLSSISLEKILSQTLFTLFLRVNHLYNIKVAMREVFWSNWISLVFFLLFIRRLAILRSIVNSLDVKSEETRISREFSLLFVTTFCCDRYTYRDCTCS